MKLIRRTIKRVGSGYEIMAGLFKVPDDFDLTSMEDNITKIHIILANKTSEEINTYLRGSMKIKKGAQV